MFTWAMQCLRVHNSSHTFVMSAETCRWPVCSSGGRVTRDVAPQPAWEALITWECLKCAELTMQLSMGDSAALLKPLVLRRRTVCEAVRPS